MKLFQREQGSVVSTPAEDTVFERSYDVIVVGLGTAGAIAAITAARSGLRVLGLERLTGMGGAGTIGAVLGYYYGSKGGLYEEIDEEVRRLEAAGSGYTKSAGLNGELKKYVLERYALDAGARVYYESAVIGVYMDGASVTGVRWIGPDGLKSAGCRILIDASGDAEVCVMAGAASRTGRLLDGKAQPYSNPIVSVQDNKVRAFYTDSGYVDQAQEADLSQAIIRSACLPTHLPERLEESCKFLKLAPQLGIREGRFMDGEEQVTFADVLEDRLTDQPVFYAYSNIDNHGKDIAFESDLQQDWAVAASMWGITMSVPIPLGALIPKGFDNVLIAGRALAIDHDLAACVRMKRDMQKCGEAAALAAKVAIEDGLPLREIAYDKLMPLLLQTGCLNPANHVRFKESMSTQDEHIASLRWLTDKKDICEGLSSLKPGLAIWSARRLGSPVIGSELKQWMAQEDNEHLRKNSAFALALLGDVSAIPVLRGMMRERDTFVPKTSRKYNQVRGYAAIYLLGKLGDAEIVPELLHILKSKEEFVNLSTDVEFINHDEEYFFQYFSFSLMALLRTSELHPELRSTVIAAVEPIVEDPAFTANVTLKPTKDLNFDMADTVRRIVREQISRWQTESVPN
ncbi:FAD-dependent oxidoreductase [Paenibacillus thalictri]|uniref:FAD-dependent oxidoreductase n=1 Tax=Paenibacillus thalictri TaxID=2527873 RepID=A0A4Q9DNA2_9BACL|nr:FAD-dependent oxidoreductase [Paenibacillus thalictri]TBL73923.1 FAD-dependent oxidoreductase [Paenibacillus thalictri]